MDRLALIEHLAGEGVQLVTSANRAGWDAPVPRTDWDVRQLITHVGGVHRWACDVVRTGATDLDTPLGRVVGSGPTDDELSDWFVDGHAALVAALQDAPTDLVAGTFLPAPSPVHFWARRQAHETAIHRADADAACGDRSDYSAGFAQDGISELLHGFAARRSVAVDGQARILLDATDGPSWLVTLGQPIRATEVAAADRGEIDRAGVGLAVVGGSSSDLYLWLWNRDSRVVLSGSSTVAALWASTVQVRWS